MNDRVQWAFVCVLAAGVLVASVLPASGAATLGPFGVLGLDKWLHGVAYATIAAAVTVADGRAVVGAAAAFCYGGFVELVQLGVPYRSASALDAVANLVGATLGAALVLTAVRVSRRYGTWASARSTREK